MHFGCGVVPGVCAEWVMSSFSGGGHSWQRACEKAVPVGCGAWCACSGTRSVGSCMCGGGRGLLREKEVEGGECGRWRKYRRRE